MKNFTKEEKETFLNTTETVTKILVLAMAELEIPNFIESEYEDAKYSYKLKFTREKI